MLFLLGKGIEIWIGLGKNDPSLIRKKQDKFFMFDISIVMRVNGRKVLRCTDKETQYKKRT